MFDQAFFTKVELILASLRDAETVSLALLGRCLTGLKQCLAEAELDVETVAAFSDVILDGYAAEPGVTGARMAASLRHLMDELPGLGGRYGALHWQDAAPIVSAPARRWDIRDLDNRLAGPNRASLTHLRRVLGTVSEQRVSGALSLLRGHRFETCGGMKMGDRHVTGMDGEQINRLIQCLGRGGNGPDGGRPAVLG